MPILALCALLAGAAPTEAADEEAPLEEVAPPGPTPLGEDGLPTPRLRYGIDATVEPATGALSGTVRLSWDYPGNEPLAAVPVHLYLNGFSHTGSSWADDSTSLRDFDLPEKAETFGDPWGHTDLVSVKQGEADCGVRFIQPDDGNPLDRSLAEIALPTPIQPGETLELELVFDARLPVPIARTGCHRERQYCHLGQWYPKLAYYDADGRFGAPGFVAQQFHGATEFFAPFADFDVTLDAPGGFDLVGSGEEVERTDGDRLRVRYAQRAVHDVAYVVAPELVIGTSTHQPAGGGPEVTLTMVTQPETPDHLPRMQEATELALDVLSTRVGPYAWSTMTVVEPPMAAAQTMGMEYQTLVTGFLGDPILDLLPVGSLRLDVVTIGHEVAHNWFQGMIASNEIADAHLDEGMTRYWEWEITEAWIDRHGPVGLWGLAMLPQDGARTGGESLEDARQAQAIRPSWLLAPRTASGQIYDRMGMLMTTVERRHGQEAVDALFQAWYARWRFGHPRTEDLLELVRTETDGELQAFLLEGLTRGGFPSYALEKVRSTRWETPLGRVAGPDGPVLVTEENRGEHTDALLGLDPVALEEDGAITVELRVPGVFEDGVLVDGRVEHLRLIPRQVDLAADEDDEDDEDDDAEGTEGEEDEAQPYWVSTGRLESSGWQHVPVIVRFTFDDGAQVDLPWDGHRAWTTFRFVRPARLLTVEIDPEHTLVLEGPIDDNARRLEDDDTATRPFAEWLTRVAQWAMASAGMWL